jgi:hypothetical protein
MAASFPTKNDYIDGDVLFSADVNQIADNINDLNTRVSAPPVIFNAQTGTTYTLALTDAGKLVELLNAASITLTVPTNASVAFPVGSRIDLLATGAGQVTVAAAGGVTLNSSGAANKLKQTWSAATLIKRATNTWVLIGELVT